MAPEQVVTLRIAQEQAMLEGGMLCIAYIDLGVQSRETRIRGRSRVILETGSSEGRAVE